jgi:hypothetical protein
MYMCASARVRAHAWLKHSRIFGQILFQIYRAHTTDDHKLHGLYMYHVHAPLSYGNTYNRVLHNIFSEEQNARNLPTPRIHNLDY